MGRIPWRSKTSRANAREHRISATVGWTLTWLDAYSIWFLTLMIQRPNFWRGYCSKSRLAAGAGKRQPDPQAELTRARTTPAPSPSLSTASRPRTASRSAVRFSSPLPGRGLTGTRRVPSHMTETHPIHEDRLLRDRIECSPLSPQDSARGIVNAAAVLMLIGVYVATWSAVLLQTIILPSPGSVPSSVSSPRAPSKGKANPVLAQRRHKLQAKSFSQIGLHVTAARLPHERPWLTGVVDSGSTYAPLSPFQPSRSNRAPPFCQSSTATG